MFLDILLGLLCAGVKKNYKKTTWARVEMQKHLFLGKKRESLANANAEKRWKSLPLASTEPLMTLSAHITYEMMLINILKGKLYTF